jgi:DNA polymerase V
MNDPADTPQRHSNISAVYEPSFETSCKRPLFMVPVTAGFPSPADDYVEGKLDLNDYLVKHPAATFFVRVAGDSMIGAGIHPGDILVVDRSLEPTDKRVVIAVVNGELTVKRLKLRQGVVALMAENDAYPPLEIHGDMDFEIWGVVTSVIHAL